MSVIHQTKESRRNHSKVIVKCLRVIEKTQSFITPAAVVDAAKPKNSPLHKFFEWSNDAAAEKYREWQARQLIARVYVVPADEPDSVPVRAFVNIEEEVEEASARGYVSTASIPTKQHYQAQVLEYAETQLRLWRKKFGAFQKFFTVVKAIDSL